MHRERWLEGAHEKPAGRALGTGPGRYARDASVIALPGSRAMRSEPPWKRRVVLEPQSTAFFLLLMLAFGSLVVCAVLAKQPVFRLLAACVAFVPAMLFGVAAVNKYYGYYDTWSAVVADFPSPGVQSIPPASTTSGAGSVQQLHPLLRT